MLARILRRTHASRLHFTPKRFAQAGCQSDEHVRRFILDNTEVVGQNSLTPELKLRLLTPNCRFWRERPELWPFHDPFWAIYWPGGQALSRYRFGPIAKWQTGDFQCLVSACLVSTLLCRYLLDYPGLCRGKTVLDLGSGCGASAIAAKVCGATYVVANDIDPGNNKSYSFIHSVCVCAQLTFRTKQTSAMCFS